MIGTSDENRDLASIMQNQRIMIEDLVKLASIALDLSAIRTEIETEIVLQACHSHSTSDSVGYSETKRHDSDMKGTLMVLCRMWRKCGGNVEKREI